MRISETDKRKITELIRQGKRMEAIKYARNAFTIDLAIAKQLIDHLDEHLEYTNKEFDEKGFQPVKNKSGNVAIGCFSAVFLFIGLPFMAGMIYFLTLQYQLVNNGATITGVVVDNPESPLIKFEYDGEEYSHQAEVSSSPPSYYIGEEVELIIDPINPNNAMINGFTERWLLPLILGIFGFAFSSVGIMILVFRKRSLTLRKN